MLRLKVNLTRPFFCKYEDYKDYPFDMPEFKFKFEICSF